MNQEYILIVFRVIRPSFDPEKSNLNFTTIFDSKSFFIGVAARLVLLQHQT